MSDKKNNYLEAAVDVFSRYGVRRATMGDIAEKAGVSRQTLYAAYASKEEMFTAAMQKMTDSSIAAVEQDWENQSSTSDKLDVYFDHMIIAHFEQIKDMPDATDLIAGTGLADMEAFDGIMSQKMELLEKLFSQFENRLTTLGTSSEYWAEFVHSTSVNFLFTAKDGAHLKQLLSSLKLSTLLLLGAD